MENFALLTDIYGKSAKLLTSGFSADMPFWKNILDILKKEKSDLDYYLRYSETFKKDKIIPTLGYFCAIPDEVNMMIFQFAGGFEAVKSRLVCKTFSIVMGLSGNDAFWKIESSKLVNKHFKNFKLWDLSCSFMTIGWYNTWKVLSDYEKPSHNNMWTVKECPRSNMYPLSFDETNETELYQGGCDDKNRRHGLGLTSYKTGGYFLGKWENGHVKGPGTKVSKNGAIWVGNWDDEGLTDGKIDVSFKCGSYHYSGFWEAYSHAFKGLGTLRIGGGGTYTGNWKRGMKHGLGTYSYLNGDVFSGRWKHNVRYGGGIYTWKSGAVLNCVYDGFGVRLPDFLYISPEGVCETNKEPTETEACEDSFEYTKAFGIF